MVKLENDFLKISVQAKGAEISSIVNKETGTEHIWQADPEIWPWHAPNLFPVVGGLIDNQLRIDGNTYQLERHGFARQSEFKVLESSPAHVHFSLTANEFTQASYPYLFDFQLIYELNGRELKIRYKVISHDEQSIYFSLGAHPAFNIPFFSDEDYQDYYLEFEQEEPLVQHLLSAKGFFTGETRTIATDGRRLALTKQLFRQDALVFKHIQSHSLSIKSHKHAHYLTFHFPEFNYLGIWAKPNADFVCIEPWTGCADTEGKAVDIKDKEGIQELKKGHVFESVLTMGIY